MQHSFFNEHPCVCVFIYPCKLKNAITKMIMRITRFEAGDTVTDCLLYKEDLINDSPLLI